MSRIGLLRPLRERDFALLWAGMTISFVGDGIYLVAIPWLVYGLSGSATALSVVVLSWSIGIVAFLLPGGVASDRYDRRKVLIAADAARLVAMGTAGTLAVTGVVHIWELVACSFLFGAAEAFFQPAFGGLIPSLVPAALLTEANSLAEFVRPAALRLVGPALGGLLVAGASAGVALLVDAGSFIVSMAAFALLRIRPDAPAVDLPARPTARSQVSEGLTFVRTQPWLWGTLLAAAVALLCSYGPIEVLLPLHVRRDLHAPASAFGLVLSASGAAAIVAALVSGQLGPPARPMRRLYLAWGIGSIPIAAYAVTDATWQLAILTAIFGAGITLGSIVWSTLMQSRVPRDMLGRVTGLDFFVSFGLVPVSLAITGPIAVEIGTRTTLAGAGILSALALLAIYLFVPGLRHEQADIVGEPGVADVGGVHADDLDPVA